MSELCLLDKEVSGFLPVLCGWVDLYLRRFCAAFGFLGDAGELAHGSSDFQCPGGFGLGKFAA